MSGSIRTPARRPVRGLPRAEEIPGVEFRAQSRQLATILTLAGAIDSANAGLLAQHVRRFVLGDTALLLDLTGVTRCDRHVLPLLHAVDDACAEARVEWAVVAGDVIAANLDGNLPIVETPSTALRHFAEALSIRRRVLPTLGKSA